jgi:hypothetical protein
MVLNGKKICRAKDNSVFSIYSKQPRTAPVLLEFPAQHDPGSPLPIPAFLSFINSRIMTTNLIRNRGFLLLLLATSITIASAFTNKEKATNSGIKKTGKGQYKMGVTKTPVPYLWSSQVQGINMPTPLGMSTTTAAHAAARFDEPTETNVRIWSNPWTPDASAACVGHYYRFWTDFPNHTNVWYLANCHIDYMFAQNDLRIVFDSGLAIDDWAQVGVMVYDSNNDGWYVEIAVTWDSSCDVPDPS